MPRFHPSQQLHVLPLILDIYDIFRTLEHAASVRRLTEKEREGERRRTRARGMPRGGGGGDPLSQYVNHSVSGGGAQKWPEGAAYGTGSDAVRLQEGIAHAAHAAHTEPHAHDAPFLASRILTVPTASTAHTAPTTSSHQPLSKHLCQDMSCRCQDVPRRAKTCQDIPGTCQGQIHCSLPQPATPGQIATEHKQGPVQLNSMYKKALDWTQGPVDLIYFPKPINQAGQQIIITAFLQKPHMNELAGRCASRPHRTNDRSIV
ncbi:hypothetical protein J7297_00457 [Nakaseomyces glabratus]|nr:hypothetical protein J7297_00457 [Nakaseomyces glabratus]